MSTSDKLILNPPKAFFTDVFGTVVNWRTTVIDHLQKRAHEALNSAASSIPTSVRLTVDRVSWPLFAQEWRRSYYDFTRNYNPDTMEFRSIDQHLIISLVELIARHQIQGLWNEDEIKEIASIWHRLDAWPDSSPGLRKLNEKFITATLSNGGPQLLYDLCDHAGLTYRHIISAEDFGAYKPNPRVYLGAARALPQCAPSDCCLIAAHLGDLQAAKRCGFKTVYIERPDEEEWQSAEQIKAARDFVDIWIKMEEEGFITLAKKFDS